MRQASLETTGQLIGGATATKTAAVPAPASAFLCRRDQ
jgi:hypothetical protein